MFIHGRFPTCAIRALPPLVFRLAVTCLSAGFLPRPCSLPQRGGREKAPLPARDTSLKEPRVSRASRREMKGGRNRSERNERAKNGS